MIKKRKSVKYLSQNPDDYISLKQKVVLYTKLIAKNESGPNSGMNKRLDMLNKRMDDLRVSRYPQPEKKMNNKLIAKFLGYEFYEQEGYTIFKYPKNKHLTEMDLHYHDDWNWLMPVVEICFNEQEEVSENWGFILNDALLETNIDSLYRAVVSFIINYNAKSKELENESVQ